MIRKIVCVWLMLQGAAYAQVSIPEQIKAPAGNNPFLTVHAKGDQIYLCAFSEGKYSWVLQAPDAKLFDAAGRIVGKHYAGPIWEYKEGSRVVGQIVNKIDVTPGSSISWLLVKIISHKDNGMFSDTTYINRVNTHGGLPPVSGCDANHIGGEARVPYTADYIFYSK